MSGIYKNRSRNAIALQQRKKMHKTIVSKGYLLTGIIIGGALAGLQYWHIHSHMAFLWLGIFGLMFVLGLSYTTHYGQLLCCAILTSFLASIPCVWLINARLPYFSPYCLQVSMLMHSMPFIFTFYNIVFTLATLPYFTRPGTPLFDYV